VADSGDRARGAYYWERKSRKGKRKSDVTKIRFEVGEREERGGWSEIGAHLHGPRSAGRFVMHSQQQGASCKHIRGKDEGDDQKHKRGGLSGATKKEFDATSGYERV